jgi:hypothetical protein
LARKLETFRPRLVAIDAQSIVEYWTSSQIQKKRFELMTSYIDNPNKLSIGEYHFAALLAGIGDTDGCYRLNKKNSTFSFSQKESDFQDILEVLFRQLGVDLEWAVTFRPCKIEVERYQDIDLDDEDDADYNIDTDTDTDTDTSSSESSSESSSSSSSGSSSSSSSSGTPPSTPAITPLFKLLLQEPGIRFFYSKKFESGSNLGRAFVIIGSIMGIEKSYRCSEILGLVPILTRKSQTTPIGVALPRGRMTLIMYLYMILMDGCVSVGKDMRLTIKFNSNNEEYLTIVKDEITDLILRHDNIVFESCLVPEYKTNRLKAQLDTDGKTWIRYINPLRDLEIKRYLENIETNIDAAIAMNTTVIATSTDDVQAAKSNVTKNIKFVELPYIMWKFECSGAMAIKLAKILLKEMDNFEQSVTTQTSTSDLTSGGGLNIPALAEFNKFNPKIQRLKFFLENRNDAEIYNKIKSIGLNEGNLGGIEYTGAVFNEDGGKALIDWLINVKHMKSAYVTEKSACGYIPQMKFSTKVTNVTTITAGKKGAPFCSNGSSSESSHNENSRNYSIRDTASSSSKTNKLRRSELSPTSSQSSIESLSEEHQKKKRR